MRIKLLSIVVFLIGMATGTLKGKEVEVKEVTISLYSRPVNGYRMVLDRRMNFVVNQIMKYVSGQGAGNPFKYEHTIIYENIRYAPITSDRDISLYYLVRSVENQFTEVTAVVMYDYKQSVNQRDFPELNERLLADLSVMVRRISGDDIKFDNTLFRAENAKIATVIKSDPVESPVEHFEEEEVENNSVLLKEDPFEKDDKTKAEIAKRKEVEKYNDALRDSIKRLNREITSMKKRFVNADEVSVGNEPTNLVQELREKADIESARTQVYMSRNDSLLRVNRMMQELLDEMGNEEAKYKPQIEELRRENATLYSENQALKAQGNQPVARQDDKIKTLESNLEQEIADNRRLSAELATLQKEKGALEARMDKLRTEITQTQAQLASARKNSGLAAATRDSLQLLDMRTRRLAEFEAENKSLKAKLESQGNSDSKTQRELSQLQAQNQDLSKQVAQKDDEIASLKKDLNLSVNSLAELNETSRALLEQHAKMEQALKARQKQLDELESGSKQALVQMSAMEDSLRKGKTERQALQKSLKNKDQQLAVAQVNVDTLSSRLLKSEALVRNQNMRIKTLENELDSLDMRSEPVDEQQKFIRQQWVKLEDWSRELELKSRNLEDREMLVERRETIISRKESQLSNLDKKEKELSEREANLGLEEQRAGTKPANISIKRTKMTERGVFVPIFELKSDLSYKTSQRQVAAFMNEQGHLYDEKFPDMLYQNIRIPEISSEPISLRMRIQAFGTGSIVRTSVRLNNGNYVNSPGNEALSAKVEEYLRRMFGPQN